jgi:hypothetical protein
MNGKRKKGRGARVMQGAKGVSKLLSGVTGTIEAIGSIKDAIRNHPEWYKNYPLEGLTALNFGARERARGNASIRVGAVTRQSAPDSVFYADLVVPRGVRGGNGFWEGLQILMNKLRAASGSNITYDIFDLAEYVLNGREIIAEFASCKRIILATRVADAYDADAPYKYAIMAGGSNAGFPSLNDITANLASDTARVNRLVPVISNMIPLNIDLHKRTAWMFGNIFADTPGAKFSTKMIIKPETAKWSRNSAGTEIVRTPADVNLQLSLRIANLETMISDFMDSVQNSRIAGDIMKAFGASAFIPMVGITESMSIRPIYDEFALSQFQNMSLLRPGQSESGGVGPSVVTSPASTTIKYEAAQPGAGDDQKARCTALLTAKLVNTPKDSITPAEVLSLTRLVTFAHIVADADFGTGYCAEVDTCGTEIISNGKWINDYTPVNGGTVNGAAGMILQTMTPDQSMNWASDDWAPEIIFSSASELSSGYYRSMFDLANWAVAVPDDISDYHAIAALSLMATPTAIKEQSNFKFII